MSRIGMPLRAAAQTLVAPVRRPPRTAAEPTRPAPVATIRRSGPDPVRVLLLGGGALTGLGLPQHDFGLAGQVADRLAGTGHGVDLDVLVQADPTAPAALAGAALLRLRRYEAVIVVLGDEQLQARARPGRWRAGVARLADALREAVSPAAAVLVVDSARAMLTVPDPRLPPPLEHADRLVAARREACEAADRVGFEELSPPVRPVGIGRRFATAAYRRWAAQIVERLRPLLAELADRDDEDTPRAFRERQDEEELRQRALDVLGLTRDRDVQLDRIVRRAKDRFRVGSAAVQIVDGDLLWQKAVTGPELKCIPRSASVCDLAIRTDGLTLINDARLDPRTSDNPLVTGPQALRFYAAYPLRTWDGYRIGTLCLYGPGPRSMDPADLAELRDFAGRVEQYLWNSALSARREEAVESRPA